MPVADVSDRPQPEESYVVYCATEEVREELLWNHASLLKQASDFVRVRLHSSTEHPSLLPPVAFDVPSMQRALSTHTLGRILVYSDTVPSTQDVLRARFRGLPVGTVAVTNRQTDGRGRRGSQWQSPSGALAFSIRVAVPMAEPERLTFVQYIAGLAAVECIARTPDWACIPLRIKWPNDLYVNGKKVGGVLCEAQAKSHPTGISGGVFDVTVGVGVNISNPAPTYCLSSALEDFGIGIVGGAEEEGKVAISRHSFLASYLDVFEELYDTFSKPTGFLPIKGRYLQAWLHSGQDVVLENANNRRAVVVGLSPSGCVRVRCTDSGEVIDLPPDVTSLDLQAGIVREKRQGEGVPLMRTAQGMDSSNG
jgi:biotin---protein ligase